MPRLDATVKFEGMIYNVPGHLKQQITELLIPYVPGAVEEKPAQKASPEPPAPVKTQESTTTKKGKKG